MKRIPNYKPNKKALPPLLNEEAEKLRLESIEKENKKEVYLKKKSENLNKILFEK